MATMQKAPYHLIVRNATQEEVRSIEFQCATEVDAYLFDNEMYFIDILESQMKDRETALWCQIITDYATNAISLVEWFQRRRNILPLAFTWGKVFWAEEVFETIMPSQVILPNDIIADAKAAAKDGRYIQYTDDVWKRSCYIRKDVPLVQVRYDECYSNFQYGKSVVEVDGRTFIVFCKAGDIHNLCKGLPCCNVEEADLDWGFDKHREKYSMYVDPWSYNIVSREQMRRYLYNVAIANNLKGIKDIMPEYKGALIDAINTLNAHHKASVTQEKEELFPGQAEESLWL